MSSVLNKLIVLKLNKLWTPVGYSTVQKAIIDLVAGKSASALNFEYELDKDGNPIGEPIGMTPVGWDEWTTLPVRNFDFSINYISHGERKVLRVPTVLVAKNYNKIHKKEFRGKPSKDALWTRDGGIDQYTGKPLRREDASADHILPKSKGGGDTWENLVVTHKEINSKKGNSLNSEIGLKLIRPAKAPPAMPVNLLITEVKHMDWKPFLISKKKS